MTEQINKINNPLTIIAIFAALAEVNATVAIGLIDKDLHYIFIWFIIGFPSLLVILFFLTLNYNTRVMYSPSDYREDKTFLDSLYGQGGTKILDNNLTNDIVAKTLSEFEKKIIKSIEEKIQSNTSKSISGDEITKLLNSYKEEVKKISENTIRESSGINFEIPLLLKSAIVDWISYPAFIPIIYTITKESCKSIKEIKAVEHKYNLPSNWDTIGIKSLIRSEILVGTSDSFIINEIIKNALFKWIQLNKQAILLIISSFSEINENGERRTTDIVRNISKQLII